MKYLPNKERTDLEPQDDQRADYEAPAIIFEGAISTRAGSPLGNPTGSDGIDPADLFD